MAQHVICRSLSSGRGGGAAKATRGRHFIRDGGGGRPPQGYAGSGAGASQSFYKHWYSVSFTMDKTKNQRQLLVQITISNASFAVSVTGESHGCVGWQSQY